MFDKNKELGCRRTLHSQATRVPPIHHMGLPFRLIISVLWGTQLATVGLAGYSLYQQHLLLNKFAALEREGNPVVRRKESANPGAPGGSEPDRARGKDSDPPTFPEVGPGWAWLSGAEGSTTGLGSLCFGLVILLLGLLVVGRWCSFWRWGQDAGVFSGDLSPSNRQEIARRQLAEVRLKRHGFAR